MSFDLIETKQGIFILHALCNKLGQHENQGKSGRRNGYRGTVSKWWNCPFSQYYGRIDSDTNKHKGGKLFFFWKGAECLLNFF